MFRRSAHAQGIRHALVKALKPSDAGQLLRIVHHICFAFSYRVGTPSGIIPSTHAGDCTQIDFSMTAAPELKNIFDQPNHATPRLLYTPAVQHMLLPERSTRTMQIRVLAQRITKSGEFNASAHALLVGKCCDS